MVNFKLACSWGSGVDREKMPENRMGAGERWSLEALFSIIHSSMSAPEQVYPMIDQLSKFTSTLTSVIWRRTHRV